MNFDNSIWFVGIRLEIVHSPNNYQRRSICTIFTFAIGVLYQHSVHGLVFCFVFPDEFLHTLVCLFGNFAKIGPLIFKMLQQ